MAARAMVKGQAAGRAVVSPEPVSFWGDFDPATGRIGNPRHALAGREVAGRVLVFRHGRGSSSAAQVLLEALRRGTAPAALVNVRTEPLLAVAPLVGRALYGRSLPVVSLAEADFACIADGDRLVVDGDAGTVTLIREPAPAG